MAFVQASAISNTTGGGNNQPNLGSVTAGNLVILTVAWAQQTNGNPPTVSGWSTAQAPAGLSILAGAAWIGCAIFYKENSAGGSEAPTIVPGASSTNCAISAQVQEHNGFPSTGTLDVGTNNSAATGTSGNTGTTGTTTSANEVVIAALSSGLASGATTSTAGISTPASSGYTSAGVRQDDTATGRTCEFSYKYVSSTGTQTASWTWTGSSSYMAAIATFSQGGAAAPSIKINVRPRLRPRPFGPGVAR